MNRVTKAALFVFCMAMPVVAVTGQISEEKQPSTNQHSTPTPEQNRPIAPLLQRVLSVLDQLIEAQSSFQDTDVRTAIRAQVADMLWSYDEPRARRLFEEAFLAMANSPVRERSIWVAPIGPDAHHPVRSAVIPAMVKRDPSLAARLAEKIEDLPPNTEPKFILSGRDQYSERSRMRSDIAFNLFFHKDPLRAAQVAKVFAERGDIIQLNHLMSQIRMKEPKAADELFILALERARLRQATIDDIRWFGSYLFPYFGEGAIRHSPGAAKRDPFLAMTKSPQAVPLFLELAYEVATQRVSSASASDGATSTILNLLTPYFERFMPDKAASFRALAEEALRRSPAEDRTYVAQDASTTIQELLTRADRLAESRQKDVTYNRAAAKAIIGADFDQAAAITDRITDERVRGTTRFNLRLRMYQHRSEETARAIAGDDFDKAEALITGTSDPDLRVRLFGSLIERLVQKDKLRAIQMLAEAEGQAANVEDGVQRTRQLMALAGVASRIDADRGFEEMNRAVAEFNRAGFAPEWERYRVAQSNTEAGKDPVLTNIGLSAPLNNREFELLGSKDLNRALAVAQEIQMKEASALAQLAACRGALSKLREVSPPRPFSSGKQP